MGEGSESHLTKDALAVAIEALSWMAYEGIGERTALFRSAAQLGVQAPNDLRQAHKLVMETARYKNRLESLISNLLPPSGDQRIPHGVTSFLLILAYLKYVEDKPETNVEQDVRWARQILGWRELHPYERAIALIASGALTTEPRCELDEDERIALQTCNPLWFVRRTIRVFGRAFALKLLNRNLTQLPLYIRPNTLKASAQRAEQISKLFQAVKLEQTENVLKLDRARGVLARSDFFKSGEFVLQDLASIVAGLVSSPARGAFVLDICAAPGNKTTHLAAIMGNEGEICSIDVSEKRLSHWVREINRTGVTIANSVLADARDIPTMKKADLVLVDPPCSNTGVFARNPDVKWMATSQRIDEFRMRQYSILNAAADHVRSNGTIVYCTCSVLPEENEFLIEDFLRSHHDFRLVPQLPFLGSPGLRGMNLCQRFYPHLHDCNGYFIAKMQRTD
jgi:16S rRNA (cytosine967-C5)-methyltransferase